MRRFTIFSALLISASLLALPALAQQDIITTAIGGGPNDILAVQEMCIRDRVSSLAG